MQGNWFFIFEPLMKVFALDHLGNGELCRKPDPVCRLYFVEPLGIESNLGLLRRKNLINLRHVSFGIAGDVFRAERRPRRGTPGRIANHPSEIADQENRRVPEILKVFQLAQNHRVPKMEIRRSGIHAELHAKSLARGSGPLQLGAQFFFADDFRGSFFDISELVVNRSEGRHSLHYMECRRKKSECRWKQREWSRPSCMNLYSSYCRLAGVLSVTFRVSGLLLPSNSSLLT